MSALNVKVLALNVKVSVLNVKMLVLNVKSLLDNLFKTLSKSKLKEPNASYESVKNKRKKE